MESGPPVVPTSGDLSWEGPFDVYSATSDMGDIPLIYDGLPGCPYQMTSYDTTVDTSPGTLGTNDGAGGGSDGGPAAPA